MPETASSKLCGVLHSCSVWIILNGLCDVPKPAESQGPVSASMLWPLGLVGAWGGDTLTWVWGRNEGHQGELQNKTT